MTGLGLHNGYRGDEWFKYRIDLFKRFTLKSLLNQTNKDFITWICVREEERTNPLLIGLRDYLRKIPDFKFIITFGGIPIWDDKYQNDNLLDRLRVILPQLRSVLKDEKCIYETCHSSDDVLHPKDLELVADKKLKERDILVHDKGYILSDETQRVADWNPIINPPFYTIMFPIETFFDPQKHFDYMCNSKSHEDVIRLFNPIQLPDHHYCVVVHQKNISTNWWHPYRGHIYSWEEGNKIMKDFGLDVGVKFAMVGELSEIQLLVKRWICLFLLKVRLYKVVKYAKNTIENYLHHKDR